MTDFLLGLLIVVLSYFGFLLLWGVICLLAFSLSLVTAKRIIINSVLGFNVVVLWLLNLVIGVGLLLYTGSLLLSGKWLLFFAMVLFGFFLLSGLISFIQMPFLLISSYFSEKAEKMEDEPDVARAEILDEHDNVVGVIEGEKEISKRLAKYFLIIYAVNASPLFMNLGEYQDYKIGDYIVMPAVWSLTSTLFFGLFVGIYYLFRRKKFFYPRKKLFLIQSLKVTSFILIFYWVLALFIAWFFQIG